MAIFTMKTEKPNISRASGQGMARSRDTMKMEITLKWKLIDSASISSNKANPVDSKTPARFSLG